MLKKCKSEEESNKTNSKSNKDKRNMELEGEFWNTKPPTFDGEREEDVEA